MFTSDFKHFILNIRREGLHKTFRKLCFRFLRVNTFFVYRLRLAEFNAATLHLEGVQIRELSAEELAKLRDEFDDLPSEFYIEEFEAKKKYRSFVSFVSEKPALIIWLCHGKSSNFVEICSSDIEMNHIFCLEQYRGRKLFQHMILHIASLVKKEHLGNIFTVVHSDNIASIKPLERCGFNRIQVLKRLGMIAWRPKKNNV